MKKFVLLLTLMFVAFVSFGQSPPPAVGNYRSAADGIWNVNASWQMGDGSTWVAATSYPGLNANTGVVFIQIDHTITLTATVPFSIDSIRLGVTGNNGELTFNGAPAITLTIEGDFKNIDGNVTVVNASGLNLHTLNIGGNLSMPGDADVFNMVAAGGLDDRCNVVFNGTNQTISKPGNSVFTFQNITFSNSGTVTISENINDIQGTMSVGANSIIDPGAAAILDDNGGTIGGTGTIKVTRIAATPDYASQYNFATDNLSTLTVDYSGAGAQTINGLTYGTLKTSGSGTKSLTAAGIVNDNVTVGTGTTLFLSNVGDLSISSATVDINGTIEFFSTAGSIINTAGTSTLTMGAAGLIKTRSLLGLGPSPASGGGDDASLANVGAATFNTNISTVGTVEYYRNGDHPITDRDYNNLTISNTGLRTWTLAAPRTVNGNFIIDVTARLTFAGGQTVNVKGNWTKNSTAAFVPGTTTINFNGTSAQSITGAALTSTTFNGLTIDNTAGVTLGQDVNVSGIMTFTNGRVISTAANILTINSGGSVAGYSASSYVNGHLAKFGSTDFTFPVGNATLYRPISISSITGGAANVIALYTQANPKTAFGTALGAGVNHIGVCEYWDLDDGTAAISGIVKLEFGGSCNGNPYADNAATLLVAHWNGSLWENKGNDGTATLNSVKANIASTFSPFTIGSSNEENPLPVTFNDVKAFEKGTGVQIEWTNLTEKDLVSYIVERSANGRDFITVSQLAPRSNQSDKQSYIHFDAAPLSGTNFYRIKVVEMDGKVSYSKLLKVEIGKIQKGIILYPNPVTGSEFSIGFSAAKGAYTLRIVNAAGQEVFTQRLNHAGGNISQTIVLPASVRSGVYNMQLTGDNYRENKMFVIQ